MSSELKIILWGISTGATQEEKNKIYALESLTVLTESNKVSTKLENAHVVIAHDGLPNDFLNTLSTKNIWLIFTNGTKRNVIPTEKNQTGKSISWKTFIENIDSFLNHIKDKTELIKEDLEILYAIDPKAEANDLPFKRSDPFIEVPILIDAQKIAQDYVNCKMTGKV